MELLLLQGAFRHRLQMAGQRQVLVRPAGFAPGLPLIEPLSLTFVFSKPSFLNKGFFLYR